MLLGTADAAAGEAAAANSHLRRAIALFRKGGATARGEANALGTDALAEQELGAVPDI